MYNAERERVQKNNEWESDFCLLPCEHLFSYIIAKTLIWKDNDDVHFILDRFTDLVG